MTSERRCQVSASTAAMAPCPFCGKSPQVAASATGFGLLEQNSALWKDARQQMREVRKLRRKLAKLNYLRKHPLNFAWWNESTRSNGGVCYPSVLRSAAFTGILALRRQHEGDGMRKFQAWQDLFRVWPSDATKLIAPSRKPDAEALASADRA